MCLSVFWYFVVVFLMMLVGSVGVGVVLFYGCVLSQLCMNCLLNDGGLVFILYWLVGQKCDELVVSILFIRYSLLWLLRLNLNFVLVMMMLCVVVQLVVFLYSLIEMLWIVVVSLVLMWCLVFLNVMFLLCLFILVFVVGVKIGFGSFCVFCRFVGSCMLYMVFDVWYFFQLLLVRQLCMIVLIMIGLRCLMIMLWFFICLILLVVMIVFGVLFVRWFGMMCVSLLNQKFVIWFSMWFLFGIGLFIIMLNVDR